MEREIVENTNGDYCGYYENNSGSINCFDNAGFFLTTVYSVASAVQLILKNALE